MGIELSTEPSMKQQNTATLRNLVATADFSTLTHDEHIHIVSFLNHAFPNYCAGAGVQLVMKAKKYFSHSHGQQPSNSAYTLWLAYEKRLYTHSPCRKCLLAADSTIS